MVADSREEEESERQEEETLMVEDQEEQNPETQPEGNTSMLAEDMVANDRSPIDFTTPPGQFSPNEKHGFQRTWRKLQRSPRKQPDNGDAHFYVEKYGRKRKEMESPTSI